MKNLKVLIGILITLLVFSTCSKDDNDKELEPSVNLLIGTWKPLKEVDVCSTGSESISEYSLCEQKSRLIFTSHSNPDLESDGTYKYIIFYDDTECSSEDEENYVDTLDKATDKTESDILEELANEILRGEGSGDDGSE